MASFIAQGGSKANGATGWGGGGGGARGGASLSCG